jgi:hypothetical protein
MQEQKPASQASATTTTATNNNKSQLNLEHIVNCVICSSMMREPCTMQCGHSFCRRCTIKWCVEYKNMSCPVCRHRLDRVMPNVNVTLKTLIEQLQSMNTSPDESLDHSQANDHVATTTTAEHNPVLPSSSLAKSVAVNHTNLLKKVTNSFNRNNLATSVSSNSLSRLDLVNAPIYIFFAFWGFILFCVLNFFRRLLK